MNTPSAFDSAIRYSVPQHQRSAFDRAIAALPIDFLRFLITREVFGFKAEYKTRLQGFALSQGFAVVIGKSSQDGTPRAEYLCIHHGIVTRNHRKLEDKVVKDSEDNITSKRQRDNTQVIQKLDCGWRGIVSYRFPYGGAVDRIWILIMTYTSYIYVMRNPFAYQVYIKDTMEYQTLTAKARNIRIAIITYSSSQRVLQMEGLGFTIDSATYYNTVRHNRPSADDY